ncbi:MAG: TIGR02594 family protein [Geminicoccaceae bacterium]
MHSTASAAPAGRAIIELTDLVPDDAAIIAQALGAEHPDAAVTLRPQGDGRCAVRVEPTMIEDGRHRAAAAARLAALLEQAANRLSVDPEVLGALCWIESRFRDLTTFPVHLFRFGRSAWQGLVERHGVALDIREAMIACGGAQATLTAAQLRDNTLLLRNGLGRAATAVELVLARLLGPGATLAMLRAPPDEAADLPLRRFYAGTPLGAGHVERVLQAHAGLLRTSAGQVRPVTAVTDVLHGLVVEGQHEARRLYATARAALPTVADPAWLDVARREIGPQDVESGSSPRIEGYFTAAQAGRSTDPVPWSGAFVGWCLSKAGHDGFGPPRAADWLQWGQALAQPELGCVVVLQAAGADADAGHVGFLAGCDGERLLLLGANRSDEVQVAAYRRSDLRSGGLRWPTR